MKPRYRADLPQLRGGTFIGDGGMETLLVFREGLELPHFAAFVLLDSTEGRRWLKAYYADFLTIARRYRVGAVIDAATWRANPDWGAKLGYDAAALRRVNAASIALIAELRKEWETPQTPVVASGVVGPRGDAYVASAMEAAEAEAYHGPQIAAFAAAGADMVTAYTLSGVGEAIGIARAARGADLPCALSFTVETDGRLSGGESLREAVERVDSETGGAPAYFMVNCAHPAHFGPALEHGTWLSRLRGLKANSSMKSHAELDGSASLDSGDPKDLGRRYADLRRRLPALAVLGGCCGTDCRHVEAICEACV